MIGSENKSSGVNRSSASIRTEQAFNIKPKNETSKKLNKSEITPYNMTPFVKLHEPIKTKLNAREQLNKSIQQFNEPAEHSRAEINLFEQSMDKSIQDRQIEALDRFEYLAPIEDPKIQQPQLFLEPPLLIPYLLEFVAWDPEQLRKIATKQDEDYLAIFFEFKKAYKEIALKFRSKFRAALEVVDFLETRYNIIDLMHEIDFNLSQFLITEDELLQNQETAQTVDSKELVKHLQHLEEVRKEIYIMRHQLLELLTICDHQEDIVLPQSDFLPALQSFKEHCSHYNALFEEQILIYTFHDNLGVERVMLYLRNGSMDETKEVEFFNGIGEFQAELDQYTLNLRELVKQFRQIMQDQLQKTSVLLDKQSKAYMNVSAKMQQIQLLYQEIPILLMKLQLSIEAGKLRLTRIKIPYLIHSEENNQIYADYAKSYNENLQLIQKIESAIESSNSESQAQLSQRQIVSVELSQYKQENQTVFENYEFLKQLPDKERAISKIQQERLRIWEQVRLVQSQEILDISNQELMKLCRQCEQIIDSIGAFFGQYKIPFQFLRLRQWAVAELAALKVVLEIPKSNQNVVTLQTRIQELLKWEYGSPEQAGEIGQIIHSIQSVSEVPLIEQDIQKQFEELAGSQYDKLLELNETYQIWKHMQIAGLYLSREHLMKLVKERKREDLKASLERLSKLKLFFQIFDNNSYSAYITDVEQLLTLMGNNDLTSAKQLVQNSKAIPKMFKSSLSAAF